AVAGVLVLSLISTIVFGQTKTLKICQGLPIPEGYIITGYENSSSCPHGAYVLKKDEASRPRKVGNETVNSVALNPPEEISNVLTGPPELKGSPTPTNAYASTSLDDKEEVGEGDVVRIDTNLVTVPVSVLDRDGRFISDLQREQFKVFENGVEQKIAYFEN